MKNPSSVTIIKAKSSIFRFDIAELLRYRELISMFTKRYFTAMYKQTILGPLWLIINPLLTAIFYRVIFGNLAQLSTDGLPKMLFYLGGTTIWSLFAFTLNNAASTLTSNGRLYSKVYFPRLAIPLSYTLCGFINFLIQLALLMVFFVYYYLAGEPIQPNIHLLYLPVLVLQTALLGFGCGLIITALTTKYRDLKVLVSFAVQLWLYATPIVYPLSETSVYLKRLILFNPMTPVVEAFRYSLLGNGFWSWPYLAISAGTTLLIAFTGLLLFNRVEKTFVDII